MGTLLTLIRACNRVKATSYRAEVVRYQLPPNKRAVH
jgi:galactose mutarotase-like enzyme